MTVIAARTSLRLKIPQKRLLPRGRRSARYVLSKSDDTILLQPVRFPVLDAAATIPDPNPPTLDEICAIVHEVRREKIKTGR